MLGSGTDHVALMLEPAAGQKHGQILVAVLGTVAHAAAHDHQSVVEDLCLLQTVEEPVDLGEDVILHHLELFQLVLALAMV